MRWLKLKFYFNTPEKKTYNNQYFRYESFEEVRRKFEAGEVISGFTLESTGSDTWVAYGDHGKKVNIVRINKVTRVEKRKECGFLYIKCELGLNVDDSNMTVDGLAANMVNYCLFLPFVHNKENRFGRKFAIIYDDWDMCNELGKKELPHLCTILFRDNVLDITY
jgi:hypothetical protein